MLPELVAVHVSGLVPTAAMTAVQLITDSRKRASQEMRYLQENLAQLDLYWAESQSEIKRRLHGSERADRAAYKKSVLTLGMFCFPLGWIGFVLQFLIYFSSTRLAVPRLERMTFASDLVAMKLTPEKTREVLQLIQASVMNIKIPFEESSR